MSLSLTFSSERKVVVEQHNIKILLVTPVGVEGILSATEITGDNLEISTNYLIEQHIRS